MQAEVLAVYRTVLTAGRPVFTSRACNGAVERIEKPVPRWAERSLVRRSCAVHPLLDSNSPLDGFPKGWVQGMELAVRGGGLSRKVIRLHKKPTGAHAPGCFSPAHAAVARQGLGAVAASLLQARQDIQPGVRLSGWSWLVPERLGRSGAGLAAAVVAAPSFVPLRFLQTPLCLANVTCGRGARRDTKKDIPISAKPYHEPEQRDRAKDPRIV